MKLSLFKLISWITIVSGLFLCLYVGYILTYPFKVAEIKLPLPVLNKDDIRPGGVVILEIGYTRYIEGVATIYSHFSCNSGIYSLPDRSSFVSKGSGKIFTRVSLPINIPTGERCRYNAINEYNEHLLRSVQVSVDSEYFDVVK